MILKFKNVGIVAHDAASGNIILHWIKKYNNNNYFIKVEGPAKKIFKKNKIKNKLNTSYEEIIKKSDFIISGTSAKSKIDHKIRIFANKKNIPNAGILDHWDLFKEGFLFNKKLILPSEIWVTNTNAFKLAKKIFKQKIIKIKKNIYEEEILRKIYKDKKSNKKKLLYLLEPFKDKTQEKAIINFYAKLDSQKKIEIIFKPHPSENINKYKKIIMKHRKFKSKIDNKSELEDLISWSNVVVGCQTYAMVLALKAKRKVYTMLPINKYKCNLPFKKILNFKKYYLN
jgi:hypothetical protein